MITYNVGQLQQLVPGTARGFSVGQGNRREDIFVVRQGDSLYAYINRCPHKGVNLDWVPEQFLSHDGTLIQCATHGALFRIEDGRCMAGPCVGAALRAVTVRAVGDEVVVELPAGD